MSNRVVELDFLKSVFILLMIAFHLVFIGDKYPYIKEVVYTFHVPAFFLISGYLMNTEKSVPKFLLSTFWIFIPYVIMESGYIVMCSLLPVREHLPFLDLSVFLDKLLLHPLGPYWYLHTLIICSVVYYVSFFRKSSKENVLTRLLVSCIFFTYISYYHGIVSLSSVMYFMIGAVLSQSALDFTSFFRSSWLSVFFFLLMIIFPGNLDRFTIPGLLITYLAISTMLFVYKLLPKAITNPFCYIGRHTFVLLVFSPIFTFVVKPLPDILSFDTTGIFFLVLSLLINVLGCFLIAKLMDKAGVSRLFCGKSQMMEPVNI